MNNEVPEQTHQGKDQHMWARNREQVTHPIASKIAAQLQDLKGFHLR